MINLLSPEAQAALRREYRRHRRIVASTLTLFCLLVLLALMGTSWWQLQLKASNISARLAKEGTSAEDAELERELNQTSAEITLLRSRRHNPTPSELHELISLEQPPGVSIESWHFSTAQDTPSTLDLAGHARDRATLLALQKALQSNKVFAGVESPVSNLIKSQNPEFALKLSLNHEP